MKRRDFLHASLAAAAATPVALGGLNVIARTPMVPVGIEQENDAIVIIIQLFGGNDGLNTIIPCDDSEYYKLRPSINVPKNIAKRILTSDTYMHPALVDNAHKNGFMGMFEEGRLAIIQGIGYENPNLSHFRSTDIWLSGINSSDPNTRLTDGWIGRYFSGQLPNFPLEIPEHPLCVQMGGTLSMLLQSPKGDMGIALSDPQKFFELGAGLSPDEEPIADNSAYADEFNYVLTLAKQSDRYSQVVKDAFDKGKNTIQYSDRSLTQQLKLIARLISGGLKSKVYLCSMGGFDTHVQQQDVSYGGLHPSLLNTIADSVSLFTEDAIKQGFANRVIGMTVSEFGRRPSENGSRGTDHGASSIQFVWGNRVKSGVYGNNPNLSELDSNRDVKYQYDYRKVYSEIIQTWFGASKDAAETVLQGRFVPMGILDSPLMSISPFDSLPSNSKTVQMTVSPNPARDFSVLSFVLSSPSAIEMAVYNLSGKCIWKSGKMLFDIGPHSQTISTLQFAAGTYIAEIMSGEHRILQQLTIVR